MKRITYVSRFARDLSSQEVEALGEFAREHNREAGITGVLICSGGMFFQIIEGDDEAIDQLYARIRRDSRHRNIICLKTEPDVRERRYPDWSMKTFNLNETTDVLIQPIRSLFQVLSESHGILEKYTQPTVLKLIYDGLNPLQVPPRREEKTVMFCDMVGSSLFSSALAVEEMLAVVNGFFATCTNIVANRGGEVTKFIGDCVMAYFRRDRIDDAIEASLDILRDLDRTRRQASLDDPRQVLFCGIGLAFGEVIEGNIGADTKMEYTVMGDTVNKATYLEALTRNLPRWLVFSSGVRNVSSRSWKFVHLGSHALKRNQQPIPVFSIDDPLTDKPFKTAQVISRIISVLEHVTVARSRGGASMPGT